MAISLGLFISNAIIAVEDEEMVKFKNRYVLIELLSEHGDGQAASAASDVYHAIIGRLSALHGDWGAGSVKRSLSVKLAAEDSAILVLRIAVDCLSLLTSTLPFVRVVARRQAVLVLLHLGSSMRSCERALLRIDRRRLHSALAVTVNANDRRHIQTCIRQVTGRCPAWSS